MRNPNRLVAVGLSALVLAGGAIAVAEIVDNANGIECSGDPVDYTVQSGDRLETIVRHQVDPDYDIPVVDLTIRAQQMNPDLVPTNMQPGDHIRLPAEGSCNR